MPKPQITGSSLPLLQRQSFKYDATRGETVVSDFAGTGTQQMIDLANFYIFNGIDNHLSLDRGIAKLTVNDATLNNAIDNWELIGDDERKDLFQNPLWANGITDDQMAALRTHLDNNDMPSVAFADSALISLAGGVVQRAYARYQAGNDEFENDAYGGGYVLRHTTNAPARWTQNIADFNVGLVYTTAHLLSEISNSSLWVFPAPARLAYKISNIPAPVAREYFRWGWKKKRSNEETAANNRVNITQHYVLEQWSIDDYGVF